MNIYKYLDYNIETSNNITIINENTILPIDINIDASAVINYFAYDICNNKSNDISLVVLFKKIALFINKNYKIDKKIDNWNIYIRKKVD